MTTIAKENSSRWLETKCSPARYCFKRFWNVLFSHVRWLLPSLPNVKGWLRNYRSNYIGTVEYRFTLNRLVPNFGIWERIFGVMNVSTSVSQNLAPGCIRDRPFSRQTFWLVQAGKAQVRFRTLMMSVFWWVPGLYYLCACLLTDMANWDTCRIGFELSAMLSVPPVLFLIRQVKVSALTWAHSLPS